MPLPGVLWRRCVRCQVQGWYSVPFLFLSVAAHGHLKYRLLMFWRQVHLSTLTEKVLFAVKGEEHGDP